MCTRGAVTQVTCSLLGLLGWARAVAQHPAHHVRPAFRVIGHRSRVMRATLRVAADLFATTDFQTSMSRSFADCGYGWGLDNPRAFFEPGFDKNSFKQYSGHRHGKMNKFLFPCTPPEPEYGNLAEVWSLRRSWKRARIKSILMKMRSPR